MEGLISEFYGRSIADLRVPSNDRRKNCRTHLGAAFPFSFLKRQMIRDSKGKQI